MDECMEGEFRQRSQAAVSLQGIDRSKSPVRHSFPLDSGGEEIRKAPIVYCPDIVAKVKQLLDQNERLKHDMTPVHNSISDLCFYV